MQGFFLSLTTNATFGLDAPNIDILIDGVLFTSFIESELTGTGSSTRTFYVEYDGVKPTSIEAQINDTSVEVGRTIVFDAFKINGRDIREATLLSGEGQQLNFSTQDTYSFDLTNTDWMFSEEAPDASLFGTVTYLGTASADFHNGSHAGIDVIDLGDEDDVANGNDGNDVIYGGQGNDLLVGEDGVDVLVGGIGNDELRGQMGDDILYGGDGDDRIYGNEGNDTLNGGNGNDLINGFADDDIIRGGAGVDKLFGGLGDDYIWGGDDKDFIYGEDGNDYINGGAGSDIIKSGEGHDTIEAGEGNDRVFGAEGDDIISGGAGLDKIYGGLGADIISGGEGNDRLEGNEGHDIINGDNGQDYLFGGDGNDTLNGGALSDVLRGDGGNDFLNGGDHNDKLYGGNGSDTLHGDDGADHLSGEDGDDFIYGDRGSDTIYAGNGVDTIDGGAGTDRIFGQNGADIIDGGIGDDFIDSGQDNDNVHGGDGRDIIGGGDGNDTLYGDDGNDTLYGDTNSLAANLLQDGSFEAAPLTSGWAHYASIGAWRPTFDRIEVWYDGFQGIAAPDGDNYLELDYNTGIDGIIQDVTTTTGVIYEVSFMMAIRPGTAAFTNEFEVYFDGNLIETIRPIDTTWREYSVTVTGTGVSSELEIRESGTSNNRLGGMLDDVVMREAGTGEDILYGGNGNDNILGNGGDDIIYGGDGLDILYGGTGADTFVFEAVSAFNDIDEIQDFRHSLGDKLDLSDILDSFNAGTHDIDDFVRITTSGVNEVVSVDVDGAANGANFIDIAQLNYVAVPDVQTLYDNGNIIV